MLATQIDVTKAWKLSRMMNVQVDWKYEMEKEQERVFGHLDASGATENDTGSIYDEDSDSEGTQLTSEEESDLGGFIAQVGTAGLVALLSKC